MESQSVDRKDQVVSSTFVPGSPEDNLVRETVNRIAVHLNVRDVDHELKDIVTVAIFNAQQILRDRVAGKIPQG
jgi:hypothetical protein